MENSYKKVWINKEWKAQIVRGLDKIGRALNLLEDAQPGCSDRYYAITSVNFRRKAAEQASSLKVSIFQIYCWLRKILNAKHKGPFPPLVPSGHKGHVSAVKEAAAHGDQKENRKKTNCIKDRKVRSYIPTNVKRPDDYIDGVKYRVIVYFGRNIK